MKKSLVLMMCVLLGLAWYVTISSWFGMDDKYQGYIEEARRLESKGLYIDAISQYEEARKLKPDNLELEESIADAYFAMGNHKQYKNQLLTIIDTYGPVEEDVKKAYEYYKAYSSEGTLIDFVVDLYDKYPESEIVNKYYDSIKGVYTEMYISCDYISNFYGKAAVYEQNGKKGLMDLDGQVVIEAVYDDIAYNGSDADRITVKDGNKYYFVNSSGYKTKEPDENYDYIGRFSKQGIIAGKAGKYGYLDSNLKPMTEFVYDDASCFYENIAAVKKGAKWALIDQKGKEITEYLYDDVALNSKGICNRAGVIWVKQNGVWSLIDEKGEAIGTDTYEEVKAFESDQLCAVCRNGNWGFADNTGTLQIECTYQDAKSFLNGFAPVRKNGLWGYVDLENYLAIQCDFEDVGNMTSSGVAPVSHSGTWTLIELEAFR